MLENRPPKLVITFVVVAGLAPTYGCKNEDPEQMGTFGTSSTESGDEADGGDAADDTIGNPEPACAPAMLSESAELFQCSGFGSGTMTWKSCGVACPEDDEFSLELSFPSDSSELNAAVCCEADVEPGALDEACTSDCARAACNEVIARLEARAEDNPCPEILAGCREAYDETIATWLHYIQQHYGDCLRAVDEGLTFRFPDAPSLDQDQLGYGWNAQLNLHCDIDMTAVSTGNECTDNENEPRSSRGVDYTCPVSGAAKISGPEGATVAPFEGVVDYTRGTCADGPCFFNITRAEFKADDAEFGEYRVANMSAGLTQDGFGLQVSNAGKIGELMLGLDVSMTAETPSTPGQRYDFTMVNTAPALFEVQPGYLRLEGIEFKWSTGHSVVLDTERMACTLVQ